MVYTRQHQIHFISFMSSVYDTRITCYATIRVEITNERKATRVKHRYPFHMTNQARSSSFFHYITLQHHFWRPKIFTICLLHHPQINIKGQGLGNITYINFVDTFSCFSTFLSTSVWRVYL